MVSKTILAMFAGQIILAFLLFYLLPISSGSESEGRRIRRESRPIATLSKGVLVFIFYRDSFLAPISGKIRGSLEHSINGETYAQFLGVRYARAPVGELRFARPKAVTKSWNDTVKEANKMPPKCLQFDRVSGDVVGKEDCLFLNIYVPSTCM